MFLLFANVLNVYFIITMLIKICCLLKKLILFLAFVLLVAGLALRAQTLTATWLV